MDFVFWDLEERGVREFPLLKFIAEFAFLSPEFRNMCLFSFGILEGLLKTDRKAVLKALLYLRSVMN